MSKENNSKKSGKAATLVVLVRHGHTPTTGKVLPGRAKGLHLSPEGKSQAEKVADHFSVVNGIAAVYSSPMERTIETAKPIANSVGVKVRRHRGLIEADFGSWTGKKLSDLRKLPDWKQVQNNPSGFRFPSGESFLEIQSRIAKAIADIVEEHRGEIVVAVSHADTIKTLIATALGTPLDLFQRINISPCSVSPILYGPSSPHVLAVNSTGADIISLLPKTS
ncbi:MAG: histidine phosphatase family protein [Acidimicrobiales bacterium]|nr:histidine phosphatase family protein [Acidimicrobiales bacterium]MDP6298881.1 histidine phosphatase family protein [Acidimicrobiales bacterium]HJM27786.1 histidine phosphatase family protein [Acidimicrobiales bacterium]HJM98073.1 histidine phosphatase family protein [Acidimicrobiales bacterium]